MFSWGLVSLPPTPLVLGLHGLLPLKAGAQARLGEPGYF